MPEAQIPSQTPAHEVFVAGRPSTAAARRSRPERADKARNRARILAAASEAFAETGVVTQMDDVAARAGLAVGTLYRHFATKDALMLAIVERKFQQILELTRRGVDREDGEPFEVLADVLRQRTEVIANDAAAKAALSNADDNVWAGVADVVADIKAAFQVLVDRAQAAGTLREDVNAADIWTASCGVCAMMHNESSSWRRHLDIVLDGLCPRNDQAAARQ